MQNLTWKWFWNYLSFWLSASSLMLIIYYVIYLGSAIIFRHLIIDSISYQLLIEFVILTFASIFSLYKSYRFFKQTNNIKSIGRYFSYTYIKAVYKHIRTSPRYSEKKNIEIYEKWRLSYYKSVITMSVVLLSFILSYLLSIFLQIIQVYYSNFYPSYPFLFFAAELASGILFMGSFLSWVFPAFYVISRFYYSLSSRDILKAIIMNMITMGKKLKREDGFPPNPQRKSIHIDLWIFKLIVRSINLKGFTKEERLGVREFIKNVRNFDNLLMTMNEKGFKSFSNEFEFVVANLVDRSQPQKFLCSYSKLKESYREYTKAYGIQFNTNKLFNISKTLSLSKLGWELRSLTLQNVLTITLIALIIIIWLYASLINHSIQIPTFPGL